MEPAGGVGPADLARAARDRDVRSVVSWVRPGRPIEGPLSDVEVGVKDNIAVAGIPTTCASRFCLDATADRDAVVVGSLRAAGARIVATLDLAEFAVGVTSQNSVHGGPRNPWDLGRVPGGSSGGSAAAVAAGVVDVALGTDTGGSIRLPSAACGVTGLRPTPGTVDQSGIVPVSPEFDTVGPIARDVATVRRVHEVLCGVPSEPRSPVLRVGVPRRFVTDDVDDGVATVVAAFVELLGRLGHEIVPVDVPRAEEAQSAVYTFIYGDLARFHAARLESAPERFQPETLARLRLGRSITAADRRAAEDVRSSFREGTAELFSRVDVVVTPTLPVDVPTIDGGVDVLERTRRLGQLSYPWSLHDGPTLALPVGFHPRSGMPVGAQVTAVAHAEQALLDLGEQYQAQTSWHRVRP